MPNAKLVLKNWTEEWQRKQKKYSQFHPAQDFLSRLYRMINDSAFLNDDQAAELGGLLSVAVHNHGDDPALCQIAMWVNTCH